MARPCVFIGSSSEGLEIARKVRSQLDDMAEVTIWHEGPFGLSQGFLDSLVAAAHRFDFAVLVLTRDDLVATRGENVHAPRDNVLFECGLFMGRIGPRRTFLVFDLDRPPKLPTDLAGVCMAGFHGERSDGNLLAAVGAACDPIRDAIRAHGARDDVMPEEVTLGAERLLVSRDSGGWLRPVQLRELRDGVSLRMGTTPLHVRLGRIEEVKAGAHDAVVLPANEYFDDECVRDERSALGAFVQKHFAGRIPELQDSVRTELERCPATDVEKRPGLSLSSYGTGTCVYLDRPLDTDFRLILAAVTTERSGMGLRAEVSFVLEALKRTVGVARTNRLSRVFLPLLGSGHGGLRPEVALFTMILGLSEVLTAPGRKLDAVTIVVFRDEERDAASVSLPVIRQICRTAAGLLS